MVSRLLSSLALVSSVLAAIPTGVYITSCTTSGTFALTFDDGPYAYTHEALDLLDAAGFKGTFFMNGNNWASIYDYSSIVQRAYSSGHLVGSHTWDHADAAAITSAQLISEMTQLEDAMVSIIGVRPTYFRPPYLSIDDEALATLGTLGYKVIGIDVDTKDYENQSTLSVAEANFLSGLQAGGTISLEHDVYQGTVETLLPYMIQQLQSAGLQGVTVADCLGDPAANWYAPARSSTTSTTSTKTSTTSTSTSTKASTVTTTTSTSTKATTTTTSTSTKASSTTTTTSTSTKASSTTTTAPTTTTKVSTTTTSTSTTTTKPATTIITGTTSLVTTTKASTTTTVAPTTTTTKASTTTSTSTTTTKPATTIITGTTSLVTTTKASTTTTAPTTTTTKASTTTTVAPTTVTTVVPTTTTTKASTTTTVAPTTTTTKASTTTVAPTTTTTKASTTTTTATTAKSNTTIITTTKPATTTTTKATSTTTTTSKATSTTYPVTDDWSCGASVGKRCATGYCCSQYGWCGSTKDYCKAGCQSAFGVCK